MIFLFLYSLLAGFYHETRDNSQYNATMNRQINTERERVQYEKKEKELDEWIEEQKEKARLGVGRFDVSGRLRLDPPQFPC